MSTMVINGKRISVSGGNICVSNNKIYADGKLITDEEVKEPIKLVVEGDILSIKTEGDVEVHGNIQGGVKAGGAVNCNDIGGSLKADGSVHCGNILGNVEADGSVHCGDVCGDIEADGHVTCKNRK